VTISERSKHIRIKRSVAAQKRWRASRVLTKKTRGAKLRTMNTPAAKRKAQTANATKAYQKKLRNKEWVRARNEAIARGQRRAAREAKELEKKNPFRNLDKNLVDRVKDAVAYAKEAVNDKGRKRFNRWIRLAAQRFLNDLERAKTKGNPFTFDPQQANRACKFVELCPHVEGKWDTPNIKLVPAQVFFIVNLFGFRNLRGGRRFNTALFAVARKNAKSTLAAAIMLYVMCEEREEGGQLFSAATTGDQARIVWKIAKAMMEKCHEMQRAYGIEAYANVIKKYDTHSEYRAINAKASTQDGLNPSAVTFDELHAHKNHDLMNVLTSAEGARDNPFFLYTTTEGYETTGPWPEIRQFAHNILKGVVEADHFFCVYYSVDEEDKNEGITADDDFDEAAWRKANPLYDYNYKLREKMGQLATEAKLMAGQLGEFRTKRLNRRSSSADAWIDIREWNLCSEPFDPKDLVGIPCYGGFDLASTTDMVAWALAWMHDGELFAKVNYWVPEIAAQRRDEKRISPYRPWILGGWLTETQGNVVDYDVVERDMMADVEMYQPIKVAYDPWNAQQFVNRLTERGVELEMFIQGPKSYHPAMQALEAAYKGRTLRHGGNPVLRWNAANIVPRKDVNLNMAPDRKNSADKIDGMCALLMAIGMLIKDAGDDSAGFFSNPVKA
jgi:phage terminase large subunit-like protein